MLRVAQDGALLGTRAGLLQLPAQFLQLGGAALEDGRELRLLIGSEAEPVTHHVHRRHGIPHRLLRGRGACGQAGAERQQEDRKPFVSETPGVQHGNSSL